MTREIKFRAKSLGGIWEYGDLHLRSKHPHIHNLIGATIYIDSNTIGQYTGLYDKNGKEIYDGDIIAVNGRQIGYIVGGVRGYCYDVIYTPAKSNGEKSWPLYSVVTIDYHNKCEVIGNIHDTPELLEGGEQ